MKKQMTNIVIAASIVATGCSGPNTTEVVITKSPSKRVAKEADITGQGPNLWKRLRVPTTTTTQPPRREPVRAATVPKQPPRPTATTAPAPAPEAVPEGGWRVSEASWYGPGFYENTTACGQKYDENIIGVAHKKLACGTMVTFRHAGTVVSAPVIDRGPFVGGRVWDLSAGLCRALQHCYTGPIEWRIS